MCCNICIFSRRSFPDIQFFYKNVRITGKSKDRLGKNKKC